LARGLAIEIGKGAGKAEKLVVVKAKMADRTRKTLVTA
jgi:hypothetical protein